MCSVENFRIRNYFRKKIWCSIEDNAVCIWTPGIVAINFGLCKRSQEYVQVETQKKKEGLTWLCIKLQVSAKFAKSAPFFPVDTFATPLVLAVVALSWPVCIDDTFFHSALIACIWSTCIRRSLSRATFVDSISDVSFLNLHYIARIHITDLCNEPILVYHTYPDPNMYLPTSV